MSWCLEKELPFVPALSDFQRYIRSKLSFTKGKRKFENITLCLQIFDVISEQNRVLPKRWHIFEKASFVSQLQAENIPVHSGRLVQNNK